MHAGVEAENEFTDLTSGEPIVALNERWTGESFRRPRRGKPYHLIELTSTADHGGRRRPGASGIPLRWDRHPWARRMGRREKRKFSSPPKASPTVTKPTQNPRSGSAMTGAVEGGKAGHCDPRPPGKFPRTPAGPRASHRAVHVLRPTNRRRDGDQPRRDLPLRIPLRPLRRRRRTRNSSTASGTTTPSRRPQPGNRIRPAFPDPSARP